MPFWLVLTLISTVSISASRILQKKLLSEQKVDAYTFNILFQIASGIFIFLYAFVTGFSLEPFGEFKLNFFLMTLFYAGGGTMLFLGFKKLEISYAIIAYSSLIIWVTLFSIIFLSESLSVLKVIGICLMIIAVFIASWTKGGKVNLKGIILVIAAAAFFGAGFVNDTYVIRDSEFYASYVALTFLFPVILLFIIRPAQVVKETLSFIKVPKYIYFLVILGFFYATTVLTIFSAYRNGGDASVISPIQQSNVILTIILSSFIFGEKENLIRKIIATLVMIGGVTVLSL